MGLRAPGALRLNVECWVECQRYGDELHRLCDPRREVELDERLKGVYGRMHVQAFKLAALFAALDWLKTSDDAPTVTEEHWHAAQAICDDWRTSAPPAGAARQARGGNLGTPPARSDAHADPNEGTGRL